MLLESNHLNALGDASRNVIIRTKSLVVHI